MKANVVEELLNQNSVYPDKLYKTKGVFVARFGFFYAGGQTSDHKATLIKKVLPKADIIRREEIWNSWPKDSYFEVRFTV